MYTSEYLWELTVRELRDICREMEIVGMSKQRKDIIIESILDAQDDYDSSPAEVPTSGSGIQGMHSEVITTVQNSRVSSTIRVSCGAASDLFSVAGKTVSEVSDILEQALNIPSNASALVNGGTVSSDYVIEEGDTVEFLKPAGSKG